LSAPRNPRVEEDLIDQLLNSSEKRLDALYLSSHVMAREASLPRCFPVSQEMLGEMICTTRSRVIFFMNKFRRLGFVQYNKGRETASILPF
jgi:CRP/FNR family transcriptional regulator, cyclic AMP receptor protein